MREDQVQRRVVAIFRAVGATVCSLSQGYRPGGPRHATTRQTKGLPDLYVFLPHQPRRVQRLAFWMEVKAPDRWEQLDLPDDQRMQLYRKKQSPEQALFELHCAECGVGYVLGGAAEATAFLVRVGVLQPEEIRTDSRRGGTA